MTEENALREMTTLLEMSQDHVYWPSHWPRWEMRDVEHNLCELAKYLGAHDGVRQKRLYSQS